MKRNPILEWKGGTQHDYQLLTSKLSNVLKKISKKYKHKGKYQVIVENYGLERRTGKKIVSTLDGEELLRNILPQTQCYFKIYEFRDKIIVQNYQPDNPSGSERYHVKNLTIKQWKKLSDE